VTPEHHQEPSGPFADAAAAMAQAAGDARARSAWAEAACVAAWMVHTGRLSTAAETEALAAAFGRGQSLDAGPPHEVLLDDDAVLPVLLAEPTPLRAWRYYLAVMDLAHCAVALGAYPTNAVLGALDLLRGALLGAIDAAGARPSAVATPTQAPGQATGQEASGEGTRPAAERRRTSPPADVEQLLAELDALIGLKPVKAEVRRVADRLLVDELRVDAGLPVPTASRHLVFAGAPGTGKTTVARIIGRIYATLGVVGSGHLVETDRDGMVAEFVGQTAGRVRERFDEADGGVLLIDEAYSLARGGERDFGREAIDALVKLSEDRRDRTVVILTGYPHETAELIRANPGLASRFPKTIFFPDYTIEELLAIVGAVTEAGSYRLTAGARSAMRTLLDAAPRGPEFGNARLVRNLLEATIDRHAARLADAVRAGRSLSRPELTTLRKADVPAELPGHHDGHATAGDAR
jgi:hypothetical protein